MHTPLNSHLALWQAKVGLGAPLYGDNTTVWRHMSTALHDSVDRVLELLIAVLPGILAFFVAVILFTLLGMGLSVLLRRGLKWVRFDERLVETTPNSGPAAAHRQAHAQSVNRMTATKNARMPGSTAIRSSSTRSTESCSAVDMCRHTVVLSP